MRAIVDEFGCQQRSALVLANPAQTAIGIEPSLNAHGLGNVIGLPKRSPDEHPKTDACLETSLFVRALGSQDHLHC